MKERIIKNIFSHGLARVFEMSLGVVLIPFLIWKLGTGGFGIIVLAEALIRFFDLAITGLRTALGRYLGFTLAAKREEEAREYIAAGETILLGIMFIMVVVGAALWYVFPLFFKVPEVFRGQTGIFMLTMIFSGIIPAWFMSSFATLYAYQRFDLLNLFNAFRNTTRSLLCFLVYSLLPPKLYYYGFIYFAAILVEQLFIYNGAGKLFPKAARNLFRGFSPQKAKNLISFMSYRLVQAMSGLLYSDTDMIFINRFLGPSFNAIYSISLKFINVLARLIEHALWVITPSYTELIGKKEFFRLRRIYTSVTKASALVSFPICVLLLLFGKDLILLWVGEKFMGSVNPMYVNIFAYLPALVFASAGGIATAYAKIKLPSAITFLSAVGNVAISLFCGIKLGWGLVGFAFGSLCASIVNNLLFTPYYACRISGVNYPAFIRDSFFRPLAVSAFFGIIIYQLKFIYGAHLWVILGAVGAGVPVYLYMSWAWVMDGYERGKVRELVEKVLPAMVRHKKER